MASFSNSSRFHNRRQAGRLLAGQLIKYKNRQDVLVLALPRGGVPVAFEIARALNSRLDVFIVRKIGFPGQEELAMGAVAQGGRVILDSDLIKRLGVTEREVQGVVEAETRELARREKSFREAGQPIDVANKTVIVVDDGLATGFSMRAAVEALRSATPARLVVAVPVAAAETCELLKSFADEVICATTPNPFYAVGLWYDDFTQTTDSEVRELLAQSRSSFSNKAGA